MSFFKRAWIAIKRRKARTAIMLVILIAISTLIYTGLAVQNATNEASVLARQKLGSKLTLSFDMGKSMNLQMQEKEGSDGKKNVMDIEYKAVTEEMAELIAKNEHVYDYNYIVNKSAFASSFDAISDSQSKQIQDAEEQTKDKVNDFNESINKNGRAPLGMDRIDMANIVMSDISLVGVSSLSLEENFKSGDYTIVEGESITIESDINSVVIEENLAEANEIKVGDKIKIKATSDGADIELTVIGIYSAGDANSSVMFSGMSSSLVYNKMYLRYDKVLDIKEVASTEKDTTTNSPMIRGASQSSDGIDSVVFYIDDPNNIDEIIEYSKTTDIDFDTYTLSENNAEYENMIKPIENVASFSKILVGIVIIAGAAIIALILMLWIKERSYETGVLLSLGESKIKVVLQYVSEVLIIAMVAFTLSILIGTGISQKVGDVLLKQEIETVQETKNSEFNIENGAISRMPMGQKAISSSDEVGSNTQVISEIDVNLNAIVILQMYGLGICLLVVATIIPVSYVFRYNPKYILTNIR